MIDYVNLNGQDHSQLNYFSSFKEICDQIPSRTWKFGKINKQEKNKKK